MIKKNLFACENKIEAIGLCRENVTNDSSLKQLMEIEDRAGDV
jgi:hypothetical protein